MNRKILKRTILGVALTAGMIAVQPAASAAAQDPGGAAGAAASCNRGCLFGVMDRYLASLPAHSAAGLPLAATVRFTEQGVPIPVGDGLWTSATEGPTTFKVIAADPVSGQVGFYGMMKQWGKPVLVAARLKVEGGRITEIENLFTDELRPSGMANLQTPRAALLEDVPMSERTPRDQMYKAAFAYFDSIEQDDGRLAPYAEDCVRHENGMQTTTNTKSTPGPLDTANPGEAAAFQKMARLGCADSMSSGVLQYITMIRPRHMVIVDEQKGLVLGFPRFVHRGDVRTETISNVPGVTTMPMAFGPIDLQAGEMFKIRNGKIHEIEAMGFLNAYLSPTGWDAQYPETYDYRVTHPKTQPHKVITAYPGQ